MAAGMAGRLTTHVLDTASGKPAAGLSIALYRIEGEARRASEDALPPMPTAAATRRCSRAPRSPPASTSWCSTPATICARQGTQLPEPAFLDIVPIRFGMAEQTHYHVPLLVSPYGYSTYRGS